MVQSSIQKLSHFKVATDIIQNFIINFSLAPFQGQVVVVLLTLCAYIVVARTVIFKFGGKHLSAFKHLKWWIGLLLSLFYSLWLFFFFYFSVVFLMTSSYNGKSLHYVKTAIIPTFSSGLTYTGIPLFISFFIYWFWTPLYNYMIVKTKPPPKKG